MNRLDKDYLDLLSDIIANGTVKEDRTGTGTISVFGRTIRHKMSDGFPLLTTKKMHFKSIATELFWFLKGRTDLRWLLEHNNHIWVGDAYKKYCRFTSSNDSTWNEWMRNNGDGTLSMYTKEEFISKIKTDDDFSEMWGELGPIYGKQWKHWNISNEAGGGYIDQIDALIENLKENPDSRRLMVNAWNVAEIEDMTLPPCHFGFQVYTRKLSIAERLELASIKYENFDIMDFGIPFQGTHEDITEYYPVPERAISLKWNQRSVDTPLGFPFNIASYGLLLTILAREVGMYADELIGDLGDTHIYLNQIDGIEEQLKREPFELPTLYISKGTAMDDLEYSDLHLDEYQAHPTIAFPLSN